MVLFSFCGPKRKLLQFVKLQFMFQFYNIIYTQSCTRLAWTYHTIRLVGYGCDMLWAGDMGMVMEENFTRLKVNVT